MADAGDRGRSQAGGESRESTLASGEPQSSAVPRLIVAVSGGADSMALLHACAFLHRRGEVEALAVTVDHGLQAESAEVAATVAATAESWGVPATIAPVTVTHGADGIEAAARDARYAALETALAAHEADWILTAHTRSDQAETVLLGLLRGSGTRSLAGMAVRSGPVLRPLLDIDRAATEAACRAQGIAVWHDPMNADAAFARVRVRGLLAVLEAELGQPVTDNLARTAELCRADADVLDAAAADVLAEIRGASEVPLDRLGDHPEAILSRVLRGWLLSLGVPAQSFGSTRIRDLMALIREDEGTGRVRRLSFPGDTEVVVSHGTVRFGFAAKHPES
nr:tRNA lysidine(34) synthetase TilS [Brevibacterium sp. XM4083]